MKGFLSLPFFCLLVAPCICNAGGSPYAIVISKKSESNADWREVAAKLKSRHPGATQITWEKDVAECLPALRDAFPRHTFFVAPHGEVSKEFVAAVHQLTRKLDDDPYTDTQWGILTGFDVKDALAASSEEKPLIIHKVSSATEVALDRCEEGLWHCELKKGLVVTKKKGGEARPSTGPVDSTEAIAKTLSEYQADLFITSGHATERDWQIGYRYKNGAWGSKAGKLFGVDLTGRKFDIVSGNTKVYLPIGNCLMGHIDGPDAMALAFLHSAGVRQMIGYTVPTWYGYQGWGLLDYFVEQPGRYSLTESFFVNHHALIHRLAAENPSSTDKRGLEYDRDTVAFYGDPAWEARMAPGKLNWKQDFVESENGSTLTITPLEGEKSFATVNTNGAQRGGRPIVQLFANRIDPRSVEITAGSEWKPLIADDFLLLPLPKSSAAAERPIVVSFKAKKL